MKKHIAMLLAALLSVAVFPTSAYCEEAEQDNIVTTKHNAVVQEKKLDYTAQAGTMFLETGGETCEIFFTAYTLDGVDNPADRPITFAFNGGPGSARVFLNIGALGPRRVDVNEDGSAIQMPARMKDNENSILDLTDLVIIDAVGTGYSRPAGESALESFCGYDNDNRTFGDFIRQYINRYNRWGSKKYVAGESYGTMRAVGVCDYLENTYGLYLNGLILVSSVNNLGAVEFGNGNELSYATYLPTYAADAWYHKAVSENFQNMELEDFLDEVRSFIENEYVPALFRGSCLTKEETDALAEKLACYKGLPKACLLEKNLRIQLDEFCSELLKSRKLVIGRYDGRITGPYTGGSVDDDSNDPSGSFFDLSLNNTFLDYVNNELEFRAEVPYIFLSDIEDSWSYPGKTGICYISQEETIRHCVSRNPFLKIWVLCGYYDLATPFYASEYVYSHLFLNEDCEDNVTFTYYPSGHMIYMEKNSFDQLRKDSEKWYTEF